MSQFSFYEKTSAQSENLFDVPEISISYSHKSNPENYPTIRHSTDSYEIFMQVWDMETIDFIESGYMIFLNRSSKVLGAMRFSIGGVNSTIMDLKVIFGAALKVGSSAIILAHCHPSASLKPSNTDIQTATKIKKAGELLGIILMDNLIVTRYGYTSFADKGLFLH